MGNEYMIPYEVGDKEEPTLWESGGGMATDGTARIIADSNGLPKEPLLIKTTGRLACSDHALFKTDINDIIVDVDRQGDNANIKVMQVTGYDKATQTLTVRSIGEFVDGKWDNEETPQKYKDAIETAIDKSYSYHCRVPYYTPEAFEARKEEMQKQLEANDEVEADNDKELVLKLKSITHD